MTLSYTMDPNIVTIDDLLSSDSDCWQQDNSNEAELENLELGNVVSSQIDEDGANSGAEV